MAYTLPRLMPLMRLLRILKTSHLFFFCCADAREKLDSMESELHPLRKVTENMIGYYSAFGIRKTPPLKKEPVSSPEILSVYFPAAASPSA